MNHQLPPLGYIRTLFFPETCRAIKIQILQQDFYSQEDYTTKTPSCRYYKENSGFFPLSITFPFYVYDIGNKAFDDFSTRETYPTRVPISVAVYNLFVLSQWSAELSILFLLTEMTFL